MSGVFDRSKVWEAAESAQVKLIEKYAESECLKYK